MSSLGKQPHASAHALTLTLVPAPALTLVLTIALIAGARPAVAAGFDGAAVQSPSPPSPSPSPRPSPSWGVTAGLGLRSDRIHSAGLDPFSATDEIAQSSLSVSYRLAGSEFSGLGAGFEWSHGTTAATARGANATLAIDRLTVPIEVRVPLVTRLCAFARVAPGLVRDQARVIDSSVPSGAYGGLASGGLEQTSWLLAGDVSGGLAFRFAEIRNGLSPTFGFWLTAEGGYGYVGAHDLTLSPRVETQPGRVDEPLRLGQLALSGLFLRARVALSF